MEAIKLQKIEKIINESITDAIVTLSVSENRRLGIYLIRIATYVSQELQVIGLKTASNTFLLQWQHQYLKFCNGSYLSANTLVTAIKQRNIIYQRVQYAVFIKGLLMNFKNFYM